MNFRKRGTQFYFLLFFIPAIFFRQSVSAQTDTTPGNHCYALCLQPPQVIYDTQRILIQPGSVQKVFIPALYMAEKTSIQMAPDDTFKIASPKLYDIREQNILLTGVQNDSATKTNQFNKNISFYNQIGLIKVPDYIQHGISLRATQFEMVRDSDAALHTFHPVYTVKVRKHSEQNSEQSARYEVLCPDKVTPDFIHALHIALQGKGYKIGNGTKEMDSETLNALKQYQQDHSLPVGGLNLFTLKQLNLF